MENIILIGMPAAGKSTAGVLVAKYTLSAFVDTDLVIQSMQKAPLADLIEMHGEENFLKMEEDAVLSLDTTHSVIATGGSVVYSSAGMQHLKQLGVIVYLRLSLEDIVERVGNLTTRGVILHGSHDLAGIYSERTPLYERYADITVDCSHRSTLDCAMEVKAAVEAYRAAQA